MPIQPWSKLPHVRSTTNISSVQVCTPNPLDAKFHVWFICDHSFSAHSLKPIIKTATARPSDEQCKLRSNTNQTTQHTCFISDPIPIKVWPCGTDGDLLEVPTEVLVAHPELPVISPLHLHQPLSVLIHPRPVCVTVVIDTHFSRLINMYFCLITWSAL